MTDTQLTLYGIANCDTVKKARRWLADQGLAYRFHDFRKDGLNESLLRSWAAELGWEALLNRRGTTWRQIPPEATAGLDEDRALRLMLEHPAVIRRPVLDTGRVRLIGFDESTYRKKLNGEQPNGEQPR